LNSKWANATSFETTLWMFATTWLLISLFTMP